ncbi:MAG: hypothetical protein PVG27_07160 [Chloroflexota bacterium]|jgi:hypothetical protein
MNETMMLERRTVELDWDQAPLPCPEDQDLPASDPRSFEAALERARERALQAVGAYLQEGWELDGTPAEAITLSRRKRRILLPIPSAAGDEWEEYCAATVRLRRG